MAGRIVRGIGAIGSANVVRGAIALFQRINHPWKDKLFGTSGTTKSPIYCSHHMCGGGAQRGFHHGSIMGRPGEKWFNHGNMVKQLTVKVVIDSKNKETSLSNVGHLHQSSALRSFLNSERHDETFGDHVNRQYSHINPWLHYDVRENNHFEKFGKQEFGKPDLGMEPVKPKLYYFNPLLYRTRLSNFIKHQNLNHNDDMCDLCRRPYSEEINNSDTKLLTNDNKNNKTVMPVFKNLNTKSPHSFELRKKWYWKNKYRHIKNSLLNHFKLEDHPPKIREFKRSYIKLIAKSLLGDKGPLSAVLNSPKYLSIIEKILTNSYGGGRQSLPYFTSFPLLPYYGKKNK